MGKLFGGGTTKTTSSSSTAPWQPQQPYLLGLFSDAQQNEQQRLASGPYTGNYVAGQNAYQAGANQNGYNAGNSIFSNASNQSTAGNNLLSSGSSYGTNANGLFGNSGVTANSGLMNTLSGIATGSNSLGSALNSAALNGLTGVNNAQSTLAANQASGSTDQTGRLAADAQTYMNSAPVQSAINSTNAAINQNLTENTLPSLDRAAAMGGSLNSSRAGAASAVARGQAATAIGSADSAIQNNAYNTGMQSALSSYLGGLNASNTAASAAGSLGNYTGLGATSAQTGAANGGLTQNLNYNQASFNNALNANSQVGNSSGLGNSILNSGASNYGTATGLQSNAGTSQYGTDQAALTNAYDQWSGQNTYDNGVLSDYLKLIGGHYGSQSSGTNTQTQNGSVLSGLLGLGTAVGGIYKDFK